MPMTPPQTTTNTQGDPQKPRCDGVGLLDSAGSREKEWHPAGRGSCWLPPLTCHPPRAAAPLSSGRVTSWRDTAGHGAPTPSPAARPAQPTRRLHPRPAPWSVGSVPPAGRAAPQSQPIRFCCLGKKKRWWDLASFSLPTRAHWMSQER